MPNRRTFLAASAAGATGALFAACRATDDAIGALPRGLPTAADYTLDPTIAYLNHGSIGTIPRLVQQARQRYLEVCEQNPAHYMWDEPWQELRENARRQLAQFVGCEAAELAITHNTTEGFNLLAQGLPLTADDEVLFSSWNHPGASICWQHAGERRGFTVRRFELPVASARDMTPAELIERHIAQCTDRTRVAVLPHVDNLVGCRTPLRELTAALRARGVEFIAADGAQAVGMLDVDVHDLGVDFYAGSPHKWLQAPKGLGMLVVRKRLLDQLEPMWVTWGQQRWAGTARVFEDYGTRNLPELLALGDAVRFHSATPAAARAARLAKLRSHVIARSAAHDAITFRSPRGEQCSSSLFGLHVGADAEQLRPQLDAAGVVVRLFPRRDGTLVRVSPNVANTTTDIDCLIDVLERA
ncbi:MAG: aminotransferase class V-fold PLP-dependent enzyme [bacterium]|nr:aminotransferase class V-fold PLP-dependent enzyme [bacterium]